MLYPSCLLHSNSVFILISCSGNVGFFFSSKKEQFHVPDISAQSSASIVQSKGFSSLPEGAISSVRAYFKKKFSVT